MTPTSAAQLRSRRVDARRVRTVLTARRGAAEGVGVLIACTIALWYHRGTGSYAHTMWAEDARIFMSCQVRHGLPHCLNVPYTGYLQYGPRVLVQLVASLSPARWALGLAVSSVVVDALSLVIIYRSTRWLIGSRVLRALMVLVVAFSAAAHWEAAGNLANLHWWLLLSALFLAADPEASDAPGWITARALWLVVACLSEGECPAIVVALAIGIVLRRRRRGSWSRADICAGFVVCAAAAVQLSTDAMHPRRDAAGAAPPLRQILGSYHYRVLNQGWAGGSVRADHLGQAALIGCAVVLIVGCLLVALRQGPDRRTWERLGVAALLGVGSLGNFALSQLVNHASPPRYIFVPFTLVLVGFAVLAAQLFESQGWWSVIPAVALAGVLGGQLVVGPQPPRVLVGPPWRSQLAIAEQHCKNREPSTVVHIPVAPLPTWTLSASCGRLSG